MRDSALGRPVACTEPLHDSGGAARSNRAGALLNRAVFEASKCRKVRHSYLVLCLRGIREADEPCSEGARCEDLLGLALTEAQEVWALRKMGYFKIGQRS